jgi:hypothetical protein
MAVLNVYEMSLYLLKRARCANFSSLWSDKDSRRGHPRNSSTEAELTVLGASRTVLATRC